MLFPVLDVDTRCFRDELDEIIPSRVIDMHTHVWKEELRAYRRAAARVGLVAADHQAVFYANAKEILERAHR